MMGSTCTTPHISLYFKAINFKSWNLGGTCTPLSSDLGSYLICFMDCWHMSLYFKSIS